MRVFKRDKFYWRQMDVDSLTIKAVHKLSFDECIFMIENFELSSYVENFIKRQLVKTLSMRTRVHDSNEFCLSTSNNNPCVKIVDTLFSTIRQKLHKKRYFYRALMRAFYKEVYLNFSFCYAQQRFIRKQYLKETYVSNPKSLYFD